MTNQATQTAPASIKKWNWGAFFLTWIWGIRHGVWKSLLVFIPLFNIVWMFVLGAKGSQWAWEQGQFDSVEQFNKTQRRWGIVGLSIYVVLILFFAILFFSTKSILSHSAPMKQSFAMVQNNSQLQQALGTPMSSSNIQGNISTNASGMGEANLTYDVAGPKASATVYVSAIEQNHQWIFRSLFAKNPKLNMNVDLLAD